MDVFPDVHLPSNTRELCLSIVNFLGQWSTEWRDRIPMRLRVRVCGGRFSATHLLKGLELLNYGIRWNYERNKRFGGVRGKLGEEQEAMVRRFSAVI